MPLSTKIQSVIMYSAIILRTQQRYILLVLKTYEDFMNYGIKCGNYDLQILIYEKCYLGKISLPLGDIIRNYPKLRTLYWRCDGQCDFSDTTITVVGCHSGNRYGDTQYFHSIDFVKVSIVL